VGEEDTNKQAENINRWGFVISFTYIISLFTIDILLVYVLKIPNIKYIIAIANAIRPLIFTAMDLMAIDSFPGNSK
jgi:hypothetical protein